MVSRYFQVESDRSGTTSIAAMLERQGLTEVHQSDPYDGELRNVVLIIEGNIAQGVPPLAGMDQFDDDRMRLLCHDFHRRRPVSRPGLTLL
ncbi:hypothetical protein [Antarctobacter sp.]|uniref:hypothetical protein n=1 Tax=Antarctobacter sp. TaxID=1872577 RepID=UPI002B26CA2E|nr:hypothetical protein [Antarctobacter sp.]